MNVCYNRNQEVVLSWNPKISFPWIFRFLYYSVFIRWSGNVLNWRCLEMYQYLQIVTHSVTYITNFVNNGFIPFVPS
jgi:hypothetical protein